MKSLILLIFLTTQNSVGTSTSHKNVVMIIFDDLRPAIFGYDDKQAQTPNIDDFMKKSFYFTRAYAQQALCAPSRNSLLTSQRPDTLHLYDFYSYWRTFAGNFTTLPQYFKENGYQTHSIGKIFHPGISSNFTDDFPLSWSRHPFHPKTERFMNKPVCDDGTGKRKRNLICPVRLSTQPYKTLPDIESTREARKFLIDSRKNSKNPFFLAIGFHKPHIPFRLPKNVLNNFSRSNFDWNLDQHKPLKMPNVAWNAFTDIRMRDDFANLNISLFGPMPREKSIAIRLAYYAAVSYVDRLFGKILKEINLNDTIVLLTSDHGWSLGEHGEWAKYSNFEVSLKVPFILYSPEFRLTKAKELKHIVELIDIFPTLVDLAKLPKIEKCKRNGGLRVNMCVEGKSLYGLLKSDSKTRLMNVALSQYPRPHVYPKLSGATDKPRLRQIRVMGYSIRTKFFRYTKWIRFSPTNFTRHWNKVYGTELYDHRFDSDELINLANTEFYKKIEDVLDKQLIQYNSY